MQLVVENTSNGTRTSLTLRLAESDEECPTCLNVPPEWYVDSIEETMNPVASGIGEVSICTSCLNVLLTNGDVEVVGVDTRSF